MTFKNLTIIDHPLIKDRLNTLRKEETSSADFKKNLDEVAVLMSYEVTKDLQLETKTIKTPVETMEADFLTQPEPVIVPILRAGLGLSEGLSKVLPNAPIGHIGVYRDEKTKRPVEYLVKLPSDIAEKQVILVDPMLATGHSAAYSIEILIKNGVKPANIKLMILVAAPEGVEVIETAHPQVMVFTAALDSHLNENAYIVPGLGDAGDRIFGTN